MHLHQCYVHHTLTSGTPHPYFRCHVPSLPIPHPPHPQGSRHTCTPEHLEHFTLTTSLNLSASLGSTKETGWKSAANDLASSTLLVKTPFPGKWLIYGVVPNTSSHITLHEPPPHHTPQIRTHKRTTTVARRAITLRRIPHLHICILNIPKHRHHIMHLDASSEKTVSSRAET